MAVLRLAQQAPDLNCGFSERSLAVGIAWPVDVARDLPHSTIQPALSTPALPAVVSELGSWAVQNSARYQVGEPSRICS